MSIDSRSYKHYKYTTDNASVNHPSFDKGSYSSLSSTESNHPPPSRTKSASAAKLTNSASSSQKTTSFKSEPVRKKLAMPLTEQTLAIHNNVVPPFQNYQLEAELEEEEPLEQSLFDKVNERCDSIQHDFEERIKQLEAQFAKAELDFNQSRNELEALNSMEKTYINQGIQTELCTGDIEKVEKDLIESKKELNQWKDKAEGLQEFVNQTRKIVWDTPFIPMNAICRQLPTNNNESDDDDQDICEYHRERIEKYKLRLEKDRHLYLVNNNATLDRMSNWTNTLKYY